MTSDRQRKANRANAFKSTGPRTAAGKARSAQNTRCHGLSVPVLADPECSKDVEALARRIAGEGASLDALALARSIAEAQLDLARVRRAKSNVITRHLDGAGATWDVAEQKRFKSVNRKTRKLVFIPSPIDQNPCAHWRNPMDMILQG